MRLHPIFPRARAFLLRNVMRRLVPLVLYIAYQLFGPIRGPGRGGSGRLDLQIGV